MKPIKVALDWYPNIIHGGLLIAHELGYYHELGLDVTLIGAEADNYAQYPIQKLVDGHVDIALGPSEHLMHYRHNKGYDGLVVVAAIGQGDMSAVALRAGIMSPKDLDGKKIACYGTFFEVEILTAMIKADGGIGDFEVLHPGKLALWDFFMDGNADACWMFPCWEGALSTVSGVQLDYFNLADYGIPYGQSPVLMANNTADQAAIASFLAATAKGYQLMVQDPERALSLLTNFAYPALINGADITAIMATGLLNIIPHLLDDQEQWGAFDQVANAQWYQWLQAQNLLSRVLA